MKTILVSGAAGFIGAALVMRLIENGENVIGLDNLNSYYDLNLKELRLNRIQTRQCQQVFPPSLHPVRQPH